MTTLDTCCVRPDFFRIYLVLLVFSLGASSCKQQRDATKDGLGATMKKVDRAADEKLSAIRHESRSAKRLVGGVDPEVERIGRLLIKGDLSLSDFWNQQSGRPPSTELLGLLLDWNPLLACRLVEDAPNAGAGMTARNELAQAWGRSDPIKCLDWIASLSLNSPQRIPLQQSMVSQAPYQLANDGDPAVWFVILGELKKGDGGGGRLARFLEVEIARSLGTRLGVEHGLEMLERSGGDVSPTSVNATIRAAAENNLAETRIYLEKHPEEYSAWLSDGGDVQMARQMTETSPEAALNWASGLMDAKTSERAIAEVIKAWLPISSEEASRGINGMETGKLKDAAILAMATWLDEAGSNHEIAPWADEVCSPSARQKLEELMGH